MEFKSINKYLENLINALREENEANTEMLDNFFMYLETDNKFYLHTITDVKNGEELTLKYTFYKVWIGD